MKIVKKSFKVIGRLATGFICICLALACAFGLTLIPEHVWVLMSVGAVVIGLLILAYEIGKAVLGAKKDV